MNRWVSLAILAIIIGLLALWLYHPNYKDFFVQSPTEIRGAIDIGSGTTNLKVAKVDPKTNKIISIIFQHTIPVAYQKQLEQSPDQKFNQEIGEEGIRSIKLLKDMADQHQAKKVVAIATAAFRHAANGQWLAEKIKQETGVEVRIIDQDEEGILGFRGALALTPVNPQEAVVWDIGGGSMQLTTLSNDGTYLIEHGKLASIPFKNAIIQNIEGKNLQFVSSPNPMNEQQMQAAIEFAKQKAEQTDSFFKEKLSDKKVRVLAVGNLFNLGVKPLVNKDVMTQENLQKALRGLVNKSDDQFPGETITEVAVSNPLLVMGYMEGLNIPQIQFVKVNNADGALSYPPYWE